MTQLLEEISQISICLKEETERVNEIALFHPLARDSKFDDTAKPLQTRKWKYTHNLPLLKRLYLKVQTFLFKKAPLFIPNERLTNEAKFKTVLSILLAQESLRDFFFANDKRRNNFFQAAKQAASMLGYEDFALPNESDPLKISQQLTLVSGKSISLIDDLAELNLQMAALKLEERNTILFHILNQIERPPVTSQLEVMHHDQIEKIILTTNYVKYKITHEQPDSGKITYLFSEDATTSSISTNSNTVAGAKGAINQRRTIDSKSGKCIGSYSGELSCKEHLLEQLFFLLDLKNEEVFLLEGVAYTEETNILFTSLFSWHEIGFITEQHEAICDLNGKVLQIGANRAVKLNLIHFNISFNALNKYPEPSAMHTAIQEINEEALITILGDLLPTFQALGELKKALKTTSKEKDFFKQKEKIHHVLDAFETLKPELVRLLENTSQTSPIQAALALLKQKRPDGKKLKGIDLLLHLNTVADFLGYAHNKNCQNATDRTAGANAADKAQFSYREICAHSFLPGLASKQEIDLFKVLYSMYLVWEEPEMNAALTTGFMGEKFYHNFFQKNPETTRYLISWLKKHPEMYLGLSNQRDH